MYCNKVRKSEVGLKRNIDRRKERAQDLDKRESSVINNPPAENDTMNMTRKYTRLQNGKVISSSTLVSIQNKIVFRRKSLFLLPCGKRSIEKITRLLNDSIGDSPLKNILFKAIMIMPDLLL